MCSGPPLSRSTARLAASLAALAGAAQLLSGCGYEPDVPTFRFEASAETLTELTDAGLPDPARGAARIGGALDLYFGTPSAPGFFVTDDWLDEERDPNDAWFELSDAVVDTIRADNEERFSKQLAFLESALASDGSAPLDLPRPLRAGRAWDRWVSAFEPLISGEVGLGMLHPESPTEDEAEDDWPTFTWGDEAARFWRSYYPTLPESAELYRVRCLTCHGASGAGDGPTGRYLDPAPRDFRDGIFKWVNVEANRRPTRGDLIHVLQQGVRGSAMPSFRRLSRGELEGLVDWVRLLAVRGETEQLSTYFAKERGAVAPDDIARAYTTVWKRWDEAPDQMGAVPAAYPVPSDEAARQARLERGAELFRGQLANCASCHGENGNGDGEAIWEETDAGERVRRADRWGQPSVPRNFAAGIFRGGDRPIDLYRRIKFGIGGSIMPAADASLTDGDIWSLVDFVLSLSDARQGAAEATR